ncbi:MAG: chloride channel protein [Sedimenticola sp.]
MSAGNRKKGAAEWAGELLEQLRLHLSRPDALIQLALLGLITGLLAGGIIVLFRVIVEAAQLGLLPGSHAESFETLPAWARLLLPLLGGLVIGLAFTWRSKGFSVLGVAGVMERMAYHQGYLTLRAFMQQFFGAAVALISGHSVGREGPHIFLGAASGSLLGQYLTLPNNSIRTMVGCGTAAGIAASFNTPLAGVIFALEVVMQEYTVASFIPVILSAVSATVVSVAVFGSAPAFTIPVLQLGSLSEIPLLILLGLAVGALSSLFIHLLEKTAEYSKEIPFWIRCGLAGLIVGLLALATPQVMGVGYDTVNAALLGEIGISLLLLVLAAKVLATVASIGLGIPGGNIGPVLFIGACLGSAVGLLLNQVSGGGLVDVGLYALLGMGAMMGASLQAPLAALTAMMELTYSPQIIMPGMLVIVVASLTASELFRKESLFVSMLKSAGMDYDANPVLQALRRIGVAGVMQKSFARLPRNAGRQQAEEVLAAGPEWILVDGEEAPVTLLSAVDLARQLQEDETLDEVDLIAMPGKRFDVASVHLQANLQEAIERLDQQGVGALYVERMTAPGIHRIYGVLTREHVESAYKY